MSMTQASAPGKVYLFGEHAVVYGRPALACAIELRARVKVLSTRREGVHVGGSRGAESIHKYPYLATAVRLLEQRCAAPISGVKLKITSSIPAGAGLGSSAAVTVATIGALSHALDVGLGEEDIARMGHEVERSVQGSASPTDTYLSTFGGAYIMPEARRLTPPRCGIVVGDTKRSASTKALVAMVRELKSHHPELVENIMDAMATLSREGERLLEAGELSELGRLMNINHALLNALGVGTPELDRLASAARAAGALGAKITGAGGGGCIVCLADEENTSQVANAIRRARGRAYIVRPAEVGLVVEG